MRERRDYLSQAVVVELRVGLGHDAMISVTLPLHGVADDCPIDVDHVLLQRRLVHVNLIRVITAVIIITINIITYFYSAVRS